MPPDAGWRTDLDPTLGLLITPRSGSDRCVCRRRIPFGHPQPQPELTADRPQFVPLAVRVWGFGVKCEFGWFKLRERLGTVCVRARVHFGEIRRAVPRLNGTDDRQYGSEKPWRLWTEHPLVRGEVSDVGLIPCPSRMMKT